MDVVKMACLFLGLLVSGCGLGLFAFMYSQNYNAIEDWGNWTECSVTCGGGERTRTRLDPQCSVNRPTRPASGGSVNRPTPASGASVHRPTPASGAVDDNSTVCRETRPCNQNPCPVHGGWTLWSAWSPVTVTCGNATVERTRSCTNPAPKYNGRNCRGSPQATMRVNTSACCPVDGGWTPWKARSDSCPPQKKMWEDRSCTRPQTECGGKKCDGPSIRSDDCQYIPDHVGWCEWEPWGACTQDCYYTSPEEMFEERRRTCECPKPSKNGGRPCAKDEPRTQTQACTGVQIAPCPTPTRRPCSTTTEDYDYDLYGNGKDTNSEQSEGDRDNYDNYGC